MFDGLVFVFVPLCIFVFRRSPGSPRLRMSLYLSLSFYLYLSLYVYFCVGENLIGVSQLPRESQASYGLVAQPDHLSLDTGH